MIYFDKCNSCDLCVVTCGEKRNMFGFDKQRRKVVVMFLSNCMVGCINCYGWMSPGTPFLSQMDRR